MANTQKYLNHLLQNIGITPACSEEERAAADELARIFSRHGFEPEIQEFTSSSSPKLVRAILCTVLFVATVLMGIGGALGVVGTILVIACAALFVLERTGRIAYPQIGSGGLSQNVIAYHKAEGPLASPRNRPVVVVAHYDSPRADILAEHPYSTYRPILVKVLPFAMVVPAAIGIVRVFPVPDAAKIVLWVLAILVSLVPLASAVATFLNRYALPYTSGSVCNKSSVAAMLGVMDSVAPFRGSSEFPDDVPFEQFMAEQVELYGDELVPEPHPVEVPARAEREEQQDLVAELPDAQAPAAPQEDTAFERAVPSDPFVSEAPVEQVPLEGATIEMPALDVDGAPAADATASFEVVSTPDGSEPVEEMPEEEPADRLPVNAAGCLRYGTDIIRALGMVDASCAIEYEPDALPAPAPRPAPAREVRPAETRPQDPVQTEAPRAAAEPVVAPVSDLAAERVPAPAPVQPAPEVSEQPAYAPLQEQPAAPEPAYADAPVEELQAPAVFDAEQFEGAPTEDATGVDAYDEPVPVRDPFEYIAEPAYDEDLDVEDEDDLPELDLDDLNITDEEIASAIPAEYTLADDESDDGSAADIEDGLDGFAFQEEAEEEPQPADATVTMDASVFDEAEAFEASESIDVEGAAAAAEDGLPVDDEDAFQAVDEGDVDDTDGSAETALFDIPAAEDEAGAYDEELFEGDEPVDLDPPAADAFDLYDDDDVEIMQAIYEILDDQDGSDEDDEELVSELEPVEPIDATSTFEPMDETVAQAVVDDDGLEDGSADELPEDEDEESASEDGDEPQADAEPGDDASVSEDADEVDTVAGDVPDAAASEEEPVRGGTQAFDMTAAVDRTQATPPVAPVDTTMPQPVETVDSLMAQITAEPPARPQRSINLPDISAPAPQSAPSASVQQRTMPNIPSPAPQQRTMPNVPSPASAPANRSALFDLPDPSASAGDPLANVGGGTGSVRSSSTSRFTVINTADIPMPTTPPEGTFETISAPAPVEKKKKRSRGGLFGRKKKREESSMSDWLGVDDDFDAKRSGRDIGSWDNFEGDDGWKGGATGDGDLTEAELRGAIASLGDDELLGHDIWFVATGSAENGNAGIRTFLETHRDKLRGVFLINLECVGAGRLAMVAREGERRVLKGDKRIMGLISRVSADFHHEIGAVEMPYLDTDAHAAMEMSLRSVTLGGVDGSGFAYSHSERDLPVSVDVDNIALAADVVTEVIRRS